jgi:hypothetical protein
VYDLSNPAAEPTTITGCGLDDPYGIAFDTSMAIRRERQAVWRQPTSAVLRQHHDPRCGPCRYRARRYGPAGLAVKRGHALTEAAEPADTADEPVDTSPEKRRSRQYAIE